MEPFVVDAVAVAGAKADSPHPPAFCMIRTKNEVSLSNRISSRYSSNKKLNPVRTKIEQSTLVDSRKLEKEMDSEKQGGTA